jgi:hypothetical protein
MYDRQTVTEQDYDQVMKTIDRLNIHVGIFEQFEQSMHYFSSITGIKWPKRIEIKRKTLNRPEFEATPEELRQAIRESNELDMRFYNTCLERFQQINLKSARNIQFEGNEYDYVMKYTQRFNLLQVGLEQIYFIKKHGEFFDRLNKRLHAILKPTEGKSYVRMWNDFFIKTCLKSYPNTPLADQLQALDNAMPAIDKTKAICQILDKELKRRKSVYTAKLVYDENNLDLSLRERKSIWSKLGI